ncbi:hypothetical protein NUW58_g9871 [Xylaria curta]|uniref:Uncharacterized protein n=1 Tax=Xylaria curta TaxID=42375 RepID=A0ACC1MS62_9PEZI|nr:hypothetical protein NUW58_g9871 [Xylaria curta]
MQFYSELINSILFKDEMRVIGEIMGRRALGYHQTTPVRRDSTSSLASRTTGVADHYRDEFIRKRSARAERTRLIVDEGNLPHAFCIDHSEPVAEKVGVWITEMFAATSHPSDS